MCILHAMAALSTYAYGIVFRIFHSRHYIFSSYLVHQNRSCKVNRFAIHERLPQPLRSPGSATFAQCQIM